MLRSLAALLVSALLVTSAMAHPRNWKACTHPPSPRGGHLGPIKTDGTIKFAISQKGKAMATYCPGTTYNLQVSFPNSREFMLTTSAGMLANANAPACNGQRYTNQPRSKGVTTVLTIPCGTKGNLVLTVTSTTCETCSWLRNSATFKPATKCPKCVVG